MTRYDRQTVFSGVDPENQFPVPAWYQNVVDARRGTVNRPTFRAATAGLKEATRTKAAYWDDEFEEWVPAEGHVAVIDPDRKGATEAAWNFARNYEPVTPKEAYDPLSDVLEDRDINAFFGSVREYRGGGEAHAEILFNVFRVNDPKQKGPAEPYVLGIQTGFDHFGETRVYAEAIAYNTRTGAKMHGITKPKRRKHVGSAPGDVAEWWETILDRLDRVSRRIYQTIADARAYEIDLSEHPEGATGFYEGLDVPPTYAESAGGLVRFQSLRTATAFDLYEAFVETLAEEYEGKEQSTTTKKYATIANRILFEPPRAEADTLRFHEERLAASGQTTLSGGTSAEELASRRQTCEESVAVFQSNRARIANLLTEAEAEEAEA